MTNSENRKTYMAYGTEDFLRSGKFDYEPAETQELTLADQQRSK